MCERWSKLASKLLHKVVLKVRLDRHGAAGEPVPEPEVPGCGTKHDDAPKHRCGSGRHGPPVGGGRRRQHQHGEVAAHQNRRYHHRSLLAEARGQDAARAAGKPEPHRTGSWHHGLCGRRDAVSGSRQSDQAVGLRRRRRRRRRRGRCNSGGGHAVTCARLSWRRSTAVRPPRDRDVTDLCPPPVLRRRARLPL